MCTTLTSKKYKNMEKDTFVYVLRWYIKQLDVLTSLYHSYKWHLNKLETCQEDLNDLNFLLEANQEGKFDTVISIREGFFHTFDSVKTAESYANIMDLYQIADRDEETKKSLWTLKLYKAVVPKDTVYLRGKISLFKETSKSTIQHKVILARQLRLVEEIKSYVHE